MMGRMSVDRDRLFYEFDLDRVVPADHRVRRTEDDVADHSAFSRVRHERIRDADVLRRVFEAVVGTCLSGARDAVLLTATAQNLRKLARYVGRPPPTPVPA